MNLQLLAKHSFLNTFRNTRRTIMILSILSASAVILFITNCYLEQMYRGMRMGYQFQSGHLQIAPKGFWDADREGELVFSGEQILKIETILNTYPEIVRVNRELSFQGILGTESHSTIVNGMGVEIEKQGGYAGYILVLQGALLEKSDHNGIMIGGRVADKLRVKSGDWLNILSTTVDGAMNIASMQVTGTTTVGVDEADIYYAVANLDFVQALRNTNGVERLLVFLQKEDQLPAVKESLEIALASLDFETDFRTWDQLNRIYADLKALYDSIFSFIVAIISVLVFLSVMEIVSMSFFERFREIGTIRAIGNTRFEVFLILLGESILYFLCSVLTAWAFGSALGTILNGMNLSWFPPGATRPVPFGFYIHPRAMISPALIILCASFFAVLMPAIRSARKQIVEVLKYE